MSIPESFCARLYICCDSVELATVELYCTLSKEVCSVSTEGT
jgi:hypothetical protein